MRREGQGPRTRAGALMVQPPIIGDRLVRLIGQCAVLLGLEKVYEAGLLYPVVMLVTILVSGKHLLLDAAGSLVVVALATGATVLARRWADRRRGGNKRAGRRVATPWNDSAAGAGMVQDSCRIMQRAGSGTARRGRSLVSRAVRTLHAPQVTPCPGFQWRRRASRVRTREKTS